MSFNIKTIITLIILLFKVVENESQTTRVNLVNKENNSDSAVFLDILKTIDSSTYDKSGMKVTSHALKKICVYMRDTLDKKEQMSVNIRNSLSKTGIFNHDVELYKNIYRRTCNDLQKSLLYLSGYKYLDNETQTEHTINSTGEILDVRTNFQNSQKLQNGDDVNLNDLVYDLLIKTKDQHKYEIKKYNLYEHEQKYDKNIIRPLVIIITLYPSENPENKDISQSPLIDINELNNIIWSNSTIDIDFLDSTYGSTNNKIKVSRTANVLYCNLKSIFSLLIESENKNRIKTFKLLRKKQTIKLYINLFTDYTHDIYSEFCCNEKNYTELCYINKNALFQEGTNLHKEKQSSLEVQKYKEIVSTIKNLTQLYDKKLILNNGNGEERTAKENFNVNTNNNSNTNLTLGNKNTNIRYNVRKIINNDKNKLFNDSYLHKNEQYQNNQAQQALINLEMRSNKVQIFEDTSYKKARNIVDSEVNRGEKLLSNKNEVWKKDTEVPSRTSSKFRVTIPAVPESKIQLPTNLKFTNVSETLLTVRNSANLTSFEYIKPVEDLTARTMYEFTSSYNHSNKVISSYENKTMLNSNANDITTKYEGDIQSTFQFQNASDMLSQLHKRTQFKTIKDDYVTEVAGKYHPNANTVNIHHLSGGSELGQILVNTTNDSNMLRKFHISKLLTNKSHPAFSNNLDKPFIQTTSTNIIYESSNILKTTKVRKKGNSITSTPMWIQIQRKPSLLDYKYEKTKFTKKINNVTDLPFQIPCNTSWASKSIKMVNKSLTSQVYEQKMFLNTDVNTTTTKRLTVKSSNLKYLQEVTEKATTYPYTTISHKTLPFQQYLMNSLIKTVFTDTTLNSEHFNKPKQQRKNIKKQKSVNTEAKKTQIYPEGFLLAQKSVTIPSNFKDLEYLTHMEEQSKTSETKFDIKEHQLESTTASSDVSQDNESQFHKKVETVDQAVTIAFQLSENAETEHITTKISSQLSPEMMLGTMNCTTKTGNPKMHIKKTGISKEKQLKSINQSETTKAFLGHIGSSKVTNMMQSIQSVTVPQGKAVESKSDQSELHLKLLKITNEHKKGRFSPAFENRDAFACNEQKINQSTFNISPLNKSTKKIEQGKLNEHSSTSLVDKYTNYGQLNSKTYETKGTSTKQNFWMTKKSDFINSFGTTTIAFHNFYIKPKLIQNYVTATTTMKSAKNLTKLFKTAIEENTTNIKSTVTGGSDLYKKTDSTKSYLNASNFQTTTMNIHELESEVSKRETTNNTAIKYPTRQYETLKFQNTTLPNFAIRILKNSSSIFTYQKDYTRAIKLRVLNNIDPTNTQGNRKNSKLLVAINTNITPERIQMRNTNPINDVFTESYTKFKESQQRSIFEEKQLFQHTIQHNTTTEKNPSKIFNQKNMRTFKKDIEIDYGTMSVRGIKENITSKEKKQKQKLTTGNNTLLSTTVSMYNNTRPLFVYHDHTTTEHSKTQINTINPKLAKATDICDEKLLTGNKTGSEPCRYRNLTINYINISLPFLILSNINNISAMKNVFHNKTDDLIKPKFITIYNQVHENSINSKIYDLNHVPRYIDHIPDENSNIYHTIIKSKQGPENFQFETTTLYAKFYNISRQTEKNNGTKVKNNIKSKLLHSMPHTYFEQNKRDYVSNNNLTMSVKELSKYNIDKSTQILTMLSQNRSKYEKFSDRESTVHNKTKTINETKESLFNIAKKHTLSSVSSTTKSTTIGKLNSNHINYLTSGITTNSMTGTTKKRKFIKYNSYKPAPEDTDVSLDPQLELALELTRKRNKALSNKKIHLYQKYNHQTSDYNNIFKITKKEQDSRKQNFTATMRNYVSTLKTTKTQKTTTIKNIEFSSYTTKPVDYETKVTLSYLNVPKKLNKINNPQRDNNIVTMNAGEFLSKRRFLSKHILRDLPKSHHIPIMVNFPATSRPRHIILKPIFRSNEVGKTQGNKNAMPMEMLRNDTHPYNENDYKTHRKFPFFTWQDQITSLQKKIFGEIKVNVLEKPSVQPVTKPSIFNTDYRNMQDTSKIKTFFKYRNAFTNNRARRPQLEVYRRKMQNNFKNYSSSTVTSTRRSRKTIFFLSPTVPYNRYF